MGGDSFLLKGWSVNLVAAMFALSAKDSDHKFFLLAYFPVIVFWILDAFFLHQEKLFRKLYTEVASGQIQSTEFTLDTDLVKEKVSSLLFVFFSKTLFPFHGSIIGITAFLISFDYFKILGGKGLPPYSPC